MSRHFTPGRRSGTFLSLRDRVGRGFAATVRKTGDIETLLLQGPVGARGGTGRHGDRSGPGPDDTAAPLRAGKGSSTVPASRRVRARRRQGDSERSGGGGGGGGRVGRTNGPNGPEPRTLRGARAAAEAPSSGSGRSRPRGGEGPATPGGRAGTRRPRAPACLALRPAVPLPGRRGRAGAPRALAGRAGRRDVGRGAAGRAPPEAARPRGPRVVAA